MPTGPLITTVGITPLAGNGAFSTGHWAPVFGADHGVAIQDHGFGFSPPTDNWLQAFSLPATQAMIGEDTAGDFTGLPGSTVLRWIVFGTSPGSGVATGGPAFHLQVRGIDAGGAIHGFGGSLLAGILGVAAVGDISSGGYNFPNVNPFTGTYWTLDDLLTGQPYVDLASIATGDSGVATNTWHLVDSQVIWFLPEITCPSSPTHGPATGGTTVTLTGANWYCPIVLIPSVSPGFPSYIFNVRIFFGGVEADPTTIGFAFGPADYGTLTVTSPPHAAGAVDVLIRIYYDDLSYSEATGVGCFTYDSTGPVITGSGGLADSGGIAGGGFDLSGLHLGIGAPIGSSAGGVPVSAPTAGCPPDLPTGVDSGGGAGCAPAVPTGTDSGGGAGCGVSL